MPVLAVIVLSCGAPYSRGQQIESISESYGQDTVDESGICEEVKTFMFQLRSSIRDKQVEHHPLQKVFTRVDLCRQRLTYLNEDILWEILTL